MWTARVGTSGVRVTTGMLVGCPASSPPGPPRAPTPGPPAGSGTSPTTSRPTPPSRRVVHLTVDRSFTLPASVTGAPRTAGRVGAVIWIVGRVRLNVNVHERCTSHGTNGWSMVKSRVWVPSSRSRGRNVSSPSPTYAWSRTSAAVVVQRRRVHQAGQVRGDAEQEVVRRRRPEVGVLGRAGGGDLGPRVAQGVAAQEAERRSRRHRSGAAGSTVRRGRRAAPRLAGVRRRRGGSPRRPRGARRRSGRCRVAIAGTLPEPGGPVTNGPRAPGGATQAECTRSRPARFALVERPVRAAAAAPPTSLADRHVADARRAGDPGRCPSSRDPGDAAARARSTARDRPRRVDLGEDPGELLAPDARDQLAGAAGGRAGAARPRPAPRRPPGGRASR